MDGNKATEKAEFLLNLQEVKDNFNNELEALSLVSEIAYVYYKMLIKNGFTEDEALKIVIASGFVPKYQGGTE